VGTAEEEKMRKKTTLDREKGREGGVNHKTNSVLSAVGSRPGPRSKRGTLRKQNGSPSKGRKKEKEDPEENQIVRHHQWETSKVTKKPSPTH